MLKPGNCGCVIGPGRDRRVREQRTGARLGGVGLGRGAGIAAGPFRQAARRTGVRLSPDRALHGVCRGVGSRHGEGWPASPMPAYADPPILPRMGRRRSGRHRSVAHLSALQPPTPFSTPLPPFALCPALPSSTAGRDSCDYYGGSAPPLTARPRVCPARSSTLAAWPRGRPGTVPVFTCRSLDGGGTRLGPCDIAVATPQHATTASPQSGRHVGSSPPPRRGRRVRVASGPDPPGSSRCVIDRRRTSVSRVCLSATLATPAPSGSTGTPWLCQGCSHPPRHLPGQAALSFAVLLRQNHGPGLSPQLDQQAPHGAPADSRSFP